MKHYLQTCLLFCIGLSFSLLLPSRVWAVAGVADTVIITGDMTDLYKWPRELAQWEQVSGLLKLQLQQQRQQAKLQGQASLSGTRVTSRIGPVADALSGIMSIQEREKSLEQGGRIPATGRRTGGVLRKGDEVAGSYEVLGTRHAREQERYRHLGALDALRERQASSIKAGEEVSRREFEQQKQLLQQLRSASTQLDVEAVQAALAASSQRLELARMKTDQTRDECLMVEARLRGDEERRREAEDEFADRMVESLRARALAALQAQKDQNL